MYCMYRVCMLRLTKFDAKIHTICTVHDMHEICTRYKSTYIQYIHIHTTYGLTSLLYVHVCCMYCKIIHTHISLIHQIHTCKIFACVCMYGMYLHVYACICMCEPKYACCQQQRMTRALFGATLLEGNTAQVATLPDHDLISNEIIMIVFFSKRRLRHHRVVSGPDHGSRLDVVQLAARPLQPLAVADAPRQMWHLRGRWGIADAISTPHCRRCGLGGLRKGGADGPPAGRGGERERHVGGGERRAGEGRWWGDKREGGERFGERAGGRAGRPGGWVRRFAGGQVRGRASGPGGCLRGGGPGEASTSLRERGWSFRAGSRAPALHLPTGAPPAQCT
jgi:hypothetical protein